MSNREIKFRAWDTKNKNWLTAVPSLEYLLDDEDAPVSRHDYDAEDVVYFYPNSPLGNDFRGRIIYQQFTGLLDSTGKEIYEGDVIEFNISEDERELAKVEWDGLGWRAKTPNGNNVFIWYFNHKIVGNLFETPELLK